MEGVDMEPVPGEGYRLVQAGGYRAHLASATGPRTLCGREWFESDAVDDRTPLCGSCMRSLDTRLPKSEPSPMLPVLVAAMLRALAQYGSSTAHGVPADQARHLRQALQAGARQAGLKCRTWQTGSDVTCYCEEIHRSQDNLRPHLTRRFALAHRVEREHYTPFPNEFAWPTEPVPPSSAN